MFGINRGTVGFLMNEYSADNLPERLGKAGSTAIDNSVPTGTCKAPCRMIAPSGNAPA